MGLHYRYEKKNISGLKTSAYSELKHEISDFEAINLQSIW